MASQSVVRLLVDPSLGPATNAVHAEFIVDDDEESEGNDDDCALHSENE